MSHVPVINANAAANSNGASAPREVHAPGAVPAEQGLPTEPPVERILFTPPIDIYETAEGLVLVADLPGVSAESLELQVQDNRLTLLGRVAPTAPPEARLIHQEYHEGDFLRSFILSDEVDHERITARISGGVLEVVLPKASRTPPRRIQVHSD